MTKILLQEFIPKEVFFSKSVKASFFNMLQHTKKKKKKKRVRIALNAQLELCNLSQIFATRSGGMIPNGK